MSRRWAQGGWWQQVLPQSQALLLEMPLNPLPERELTKAFVAASRLPWQQLAELFPLFEWEKPVLLLA